MVVSLIIYKFFIGHVVSYGAYICLYFLLCLDTAESTEDDLRLDLYFTSRTEVVYFPGYAPVLSV